MKEQKFKITVIPFEWDDEDRDDLPVDEKIDFWVTQSEIDRYVDLDELAGDLLCEKYNATVLDWEVL